MIINSIKLKNFQPYYREHLIELSEGVNLILGPSGKGKSTLFNAFYWTLFGRLHYTDDGWCERTSRGWMNVNNPTAARVAPSIDIINSRALCEQKGTEAVEMYVEITLTTDKQQYYGQKRYIITRSITAHRIDSDDWNSDINWQLSNDKLSVSYDTNTGTIFKDDIEAEEIIRALFNPNIRNYIWFQGESLNKLIDFKDPSTLAAAVKHISYYPAYENMLKTVNQAIRKVSKDEQTKIATANKQNQKIKDLLSEIDKIQNNLDFAIQERENNIDKKEVLQQKLVENETKIRTLANFSSLVAEYAECEAKVKEALKEVANTDLALKIKTPNWCLRGIGGLIEEARNIISKYTEKEFTAPVAKYVDEPGKTKLEQILRDKKCFVCGTEFEDGGDQYHYILERLKTQEEFYHELEEYKRNLESSYLFTIFIGKIQDYPDRIERSIKSIDETYSKLSTKLDTQIATKNKWIERKRSVDEKIDRVKAQYGIDPVKQASNVSIIEGNTQLNRTSIDKLTTQIEVLDKAIDKYTADLRRLKSELSGSQAGINDVVETKWREYSEVLLPVCKKVQEEARYDLLNKIRETSNELYEKFTRHDDGYKGIIEINDDYTFKREPGLNTGHNVRKKMAILNAMLMLNQKAQGVYYPFIADAPTSDLDTVSTHKYLLGIQDVFKQSIIMTKEIRVGTKECKDLLEQDNITRVYEIEHKDGGANPERHEVYSILRRIK